MPTTKSGEKITWKEFIKRWWKQIGLQLPTTKLKHIKGNVLDSNETEYKA